MKSPDEIKKGLEICSCDEDRDKCVRCPYFDGPCRNDLNAIEKDTLALIQQLEATVSEKEKVVAELSGIIGQLEAERNQLLEKIEMLETTSEE